MNLQSFYNSPNFGSRNLIPNNFYQTFKSSDIDDEHGQILQKFRNENLDFNFFFFDDEKMDEYMANNWGHRKIFKAYKLSKFGASKADRWRYCVLYQFGGVYLDFDSRIKCSLSHIVGTDFEEVISYENNSLLDFISPIYTPDIEFFLNAKPKSNILEKTENPALNWMLAFKKEHPLLEIVIKNIEKYCDFFIDRRFDSTHMAVVNCTGPIMFTRSLWEYSQRAVNIYQCGIDLNGQALFKDVPLNGTYALDQSAYTNHSRTEIMGQSKRMLLYV